MTFGHPFVLWALLLLPFAVLLFAKQEVSRTRLLRELVAARLAPKLAASASASRRRLKFWLLLAGLAALIIATASPQRGFTLDQRKTKGRDVILAIDVSKSMLANDLTPSRLARAKLAAEDLISLLPGDRIGIVAFAGSAFLQAPLTVDRLAVRASLQELNTDVIPRGGTNIAEAIRTAAEAFGKGESNARALIIFSDGEELEENALEAARKAHGNFRIFTVGIGSAEGSVISIPGKEGKIGYVKDEQGQIVKSRLDEHALSEVADASGGFYVHLESGPAEMQRIVNVGLSHLGEDEHDEAFAKKSIDHYMWPVGVGVVLLVIATLLGDRNRTRKTEAKPHKAKVAAILIAALLLPAASYAGNAGVEAYEMGEYGKAESSFEKQLDKKPDSAVLQYNLGNAAYKSGNFDRAMDAFGKALTSDDPVLRAKAEYNFANSLVQRGWNQKKAEAKIQDLNNALQHYDAALKLHPKESNTEYNRAQTAKLIEELKKQEEQKQQQKDKDKEKKDQEKKDSKDGEKKPSDGKGEKKDQKGDQKQQGQKDQQKQNDQQSGSQGQKDQQSQEGQKGGEEKESDSTTDKEAGKSGAKEGANDQKDGESKDAEGKEAKPGEQNEPGKQGAEPKPSAGEKDDDKEKKDAEKRKAEQQAAQAKESRKLSGEISAADQNAPKGTEAEQAAAEAREAAEDAAAAANGRMTESQARVLLDSLKGEDDHVKLLNPTDVRGAGRPTKDW